MINNYAFIDGQNLYFGIKGLNWEFDYARFAVHLKETYNANKIFLFLGYIESNTSLYTSLKDYGYTLVFKEVSRSKDGEIKGKGRLEYLSNIRKVLEVKKRP